MQCRVKNWEVFQHYSNRNPPWIKLHVRLLNDRDFLALSPQCKALLLMCWLLASENAGEVDASLDNLRFRLRWNQLAQKTISKLIGDGWLIDASNSLAPAPASVSVSASESVSEKEEKSGPQGVEIPEALDSSVFRKAWAEWLDYRRETKRRPVSVRAAGAQLKKLAVNPGAAVATIENSIANDWQGLFPEKLSAKSGGKTKLAPPMAEEAALTDYWDKRRKEKRGP